MAKAQTKTAIVYHEKQKVRRPGVHAKTRTSRLKGSKHYVKAYAGQGR